ncbi:hypothetical protein TNIN_331871 [Trichonephila inaurata madagascariensis]|uniref:Uncharacterized protein n=1 Tax=Trichonephila inaurata madagascariensis TaxID=2747483 RepID=A0A8X6YU66_9ARAC|nr:hypothetical protein TNIN_331871 [Trichonephila inaurata madagascariensis]
MSSFQKSPDLCSVNTRRKTGKLHFRLYDVDEAYSILSSYPSIHFRFAKKKMRRIMLPTKIHLTSSFQTVQQERYFAQHSPVNFAPTPRKVPTPLFTHFSQFDDVA